MKKNRKLKFKVGDKVKIVGVPDYGVCTVAEVDHNDPDVPYRIEYGTSPNGTDNWTWAAQTELCAAKKSAKKSAKKPTKEKATPKLPPLKFKVGDRVFCGATFGSFTPEHKFGTVREVRTSEELRGIPYLIRVDGEDQNPSVALWFTEDEVFAPRKFKVGDKVRAVLGGVERSAVVELVDPPSNATRIPYFVASCDEPRHSIWAGDDQLTLEAPEPTLKFKVGDRVAYPPNLQGVYTVVDARDDSLQLECVSTGARAWVSGAGLVAAPEPTLKFKVGDKVFCGKPHGGDREVFQNGEVISVDTEEVYGGRSIPYYVRTEDGEGRWYAETEVCEPKALPLKFKVGDKVSVTFSDGSSLSGTVVEVDAARHTTIPYKVQVSNTQYWKWFRTDQLSPLIETAPLEICVGDIVTVEAGAQNFTTDPHIVRNVKVVAINLVGTRKVYLAALPASVGWVAFDTTDTITLVKAGGAK